MPQKVLLAQIEPSALNAGWQTLLLGYGPLGVIALIGLYFVVYYGPRIIEAHISFTTTCKETQVRIADTMETLTETHGISGKHHNTTHKVLGHFAHAAKEAIDCPDVQKHIDKAIDELGK